MYRTSNQEEHLCGIKNYLNDTHAVMCILTMNSAWIPAHKNQCWRFILKNLRTETSCFVTGSDGFSLLGKVLEKFRFTIAFLGGYLAPAHTVLIKNDITVILTEN
jgi:hypothetical protein